MGLHLLFRILTLSQFKDVICVCVFLTFEISFVFQSRAKALADLQQMQPVQIEKLSDKQCQPVSQLKFVTDAWLQVLQFLLVLGYDRRSFCEESYDSNVTW